LSKFDVDGMSRVKLSGKFNFYPYRSNITHKSARGPNQIPRPTQINYPQPSLHDACAGEQL